MSLALQREAKQQQLCDEMHIGLKQVFRYCPYSSGHQQKKQKQKHTKKHEQKHHAEGKDTDHIVHSVMIHNSLARC